MLLALNQPWFFWLAVLLVGSGVLGIIATAIGYYVKVLSNKAHRR